MLADMKSKKYCLHPGRMIVEVAGRTEAGEPTNKAVRATRHFGAKDLIEAYGVDEKECVVWSAECVGLDHLIHLRPDIKGRYELPVKEKED